MCRIFRGTGRLGSGIPRYPLPLGFSWRDKHRGPHPVDHNLVDSRGRTPEEFCGSTLLSEIAELTGGREFAVDRLQDVPDAAAKIGRELRNYYVLGFSPSGPLHHGKYHRIQVKLTPPRGMSRLQARWRQGYYAPAE